MNRTLKPQSTFRRLCSMIALAFLPIFGVVQARFASAAIITVTNVSDFPLPFGCNLRQAIVAHNQKEKPAFSNCTAGTGSDTIVLKPEEARTETKTIEIGSLLDPIEGNLTIEPNQHNVCNNLRGVAYLRVTKNATLILNGVSVVVNGVQPISVLDNDGGTVIIQANGTSGPCEYSNQSGTGGKTLIGGVLNNRDNGNSTIRSANFINSSAGQKGGAIYIDSGAVNISAANLSGNNAPDGGAIFVNRGASLTIASNDFSINNNQANTAGAIYNSGGFLTIQRNPAATLVNVDIAFNKATANGGGAIYSLGGRLSIDGIEINNNSSTGSGGAVWLDSIASANLDQITRTYFHDNSSSGNGGAIYMHNASLLNISGDTFARDRAVGLGGGIYGDGAGNLKVLNSTFVGGASRDGAVLAESESGEVTFSTLLASDLRRTGSSTLIHLSNSILQNVTCSPAVIDDNLNLQFGSTACLGGANNMDPLLGTLQNNGGPTLTIAVLADSPAIGAIKNGDCTDQEGNPITTDERVFTRPATPGGPCTIGAFEFGAAPAPGGIGGIPPGI